MWVILKITEPHLCLSAWSFIYVCIQYDHHHKHSYYKSQNILLYHDCYCYDNDYYFKAILFTYIHRTIITSTVHSFFSFIYSQLTVHFNGNVNKYCSTGSGLWTHLLNALLPRSVLLYVLLIKYIDTHGHSLWMLPHISEVQFCCENKYININKNITFNNQVTKLLKPTIWELHSSYM